MILLKNARFISGTRIYKSGDAIPDNAVTRGLVEKGLAIIANDRPPTKRDKSDTTRKNDEVDS